MLSVEPFSPFGKIKLSVTVDDLLLWKGIPWAPGHSPHTVCRDLAKSFAGHGITGVYAFSGTAPSEQDKELLGVFDRWMERGHFISNHTHYHANLNWIEASEYVRDIERTEAIIAPWARHSPAKFFRYAMDNWGNSQSKFDAVAVFLARNGYQPAPISVWFYDTEFLPAHYRACLSRDAHAIAQLRNLFVDTAIQQLRIQSTAARAMFGRDPVYIWLVHATPLAAECIDRILEGFEAGGVEFVPLAEAMADPINRQPVPLITSRFLNHIQKWAAIRSLDLQECPPAVLEEIERIYPMAGLSRPDVMTRVFKSICDEVNGNYIPKTY